MESLRTQRSTFFLWFSLCWGLKVLPASCVVERSKSGKKTKQNLPACICAPTMLGSFHDALCTTTLCEHRNCRLSLAKTKYMCDAYRVNYKRLPHSINPTRQIFHHKSRCEYSWCTQQCSRDRQGSFFIRLRPPLVVSLSFAKRNEHKTRREPLKF